MSEPKTDEIIDLVINDPFSDTGELSNYDKWQYIKQQMSSIDEDSLEKDFDFSIAYKKANQDKLLVAIFIAELQGIINGIQFEHHRQEENDDMTLFYNMKLTNCAFWCRKMVDKYAAYEEKRPVNHNWIN